MTNRNEDLLKSEIAEGLVGDFQNGEKEGITSLELVEQINLFRKQEKGSSCKLMTDYLLFNLIEYEFEEEIDECEMSPIFVKNKNGEDVKVYTLSFKQAKQVLMFETRFVRKQVISYIECLENTCEENTSIKLMQNYTSALGELAVLEKEKIKLQEENRSMMPKAEFFDGIVGSDILFDMNQAAVRLNTEGLDREVLLKFLREQNVLTGDNRPYQQFIDEGYFKTIEVKWVEPDNEITHVSTKIMIFTRGLEFIGKLVRQKFNKTNNK